jgi:UDP-3-O-[3-hydroxymyristoyl] N-acetylglucosamine deacetylase/3-hydroxyacyl-[acyl-carrier-protein] dehydratase
MNRTTLKKTIVINGIGLHTGKESTITIHPVELGKGIKFLRKDLEGSQPINADVSNIFLTQRSTTLGKAGNTVQTVEHLLASFYALGITDALVEVDGPEIPILDGSAKIYCDLLQNQISKSDVNIDVFEIQEPMHFKDENSEAEYYIFPSPDFSVNTMVELNSEAWSDQSAELATMDDFIKEIAPARTYVFANELIALARNGLIKGGDLSNAVVLVDKEYTREDIEKIKTALGSDISVELNSQVFNPDGLRFNNEPARHKILDILGDLSLLGIRIKGKIIAHKPGHTGNTKLAKYLKREYLEFKKLKNKPIYDPNKEPVLDLAGVKNLLPHRYPFLLVDKIISLTETLVIGVKSITFNESFFQGHFPDNPVFPGVLQMEALAQTGGILALSNVGDPHNWDTYFLKMDNVKFKNKVVPGDTLILKMELLSPIRRGIVHMQGTTYVGNKIVSEGELIAQIIKRT